LDGVNLPTPSQSGIWRRVIRDAELMKEKIKKVLMDENNFCLHFDGKRIINHEFQVVCLQSPEKQIKLGILKCASGSSSHIFDEMKALLDEYDAWKCIQMIVCDTTAVNTGRKNGIVAKIQNETTRQGFPKPQYVGCQHHILDRIFKHALDFWSQYQSKKPTMSYKFIEEVTQNYEELQRQYKGEIRMKEYDNPGWRHDFRFLFELCNATNF
jgi:hypothetical protein